MTNDRSNVLSRSSIKIQSSRGWSHFETASDRAQQKLFNKEQWSKIRAILDKDPTKYGISQRELL